MYKIIDKYFLTNKYDSIDVTIDELKVYFKANTLYSIVDASNKDITDQQFTNIFRQLFSGLEDVNIHIEKSYVFVCTDDVNYGYELLGNIKYPEGIMQSRCVIDTNKKQFVVDQSADIGFEEICSDVAEYFNIYSNQSRTSDTEEDDEPKETVKDYLKYSCVHIALINIIIFIAMSFLKDEAFHEVLMKYGVLVDKVVKEHEWYRMITSIFLHFDAEHLISNMLSLLVIGIYLEKGVGRIRFLVTYFATGFLANIVSLGYNIYSDSGDTLSAGASGAIYGVIGLLVMALLTMRTKVGKINAARLLLYLALVIYSQLSITEIDNAAHIGGLLSGMVMGVIFAIEAKIVSNNKQ